MGDVDLEQSLISEFGEFGIDIDGNLDVLEKLCDLCKKHNLQCDEIVASWVNFSYKGTSSLDISSEALDEFEKKEINNKHSMKTPTSRKSNTPYRPKTYDINTIGHVNIKDRQDEEDMLGSYATTPQGKASIKKRLKETPEDQVSNKRIASMNSTPIASFSPASISPSINTPSLKYESRIGKGDVVASYGISEKTDINWKGCAKKITIKNYNEDCNVKKTYQHMFQKLQEKADVLNEIINILSNQMKQNLLLDEFESAGIKCLEDVYYSGRICCDSVGRINSKSIVLEGSKETSGGLRIPIDLSRVKNYSLFPGQIVALQGKNQTGERIFPSTIYTGDRLPYFSATKKELKIDEGQFTVFVTSGPFATCDENILSYTPLDDLLNTVETEAPDVLIMLGPFVDSKQPKIEKGDVDESFEELYEHCRDKVAASVKNLKTKVVFLPSQRDVFHEFVYPQPPFENDPNKRIMMMADPCTIMINDVCFGLTSTDILFHIGAEEVSSVRSDRLGRLANHLLMQQCYYPLHPTSEDVNLDYERFESHCFMPVTPDVLIVPSDLRYFMKDVDGCFCVNPGRLVKGQTGGTYLKMLVKPRKPQNADKSSVVAHSIAQIVKL